MAPQRRKNKRNLIIGGVILTALVIAGGVGVWAATRNNRAEENTEITEVEAKENTEISEGKTSDVEDTPEIKQPKQYEGDDPNEAESLSGAITYAEVMGENLVIGTNIDQFLGSGTCDLRIMRSGDIVYSATANIVAGVATSACDGFEVPVSVLSSGSFEIIINLSADGKTGTIRGEGSI